MKNKLKNLEEYKQNRDADVIEKCVICGAETPYKISTPIDQREYYVEGSGQICQSCHLNIYIKKDRW